MTTGAGAGALPVGAGPLGGASSVPAVVGAGVIVDTALNPLTVPVTAQMIGFTGTVAESEILSLRIYLFIIEQIRLADINEGALFLKRFLEGPQQVWETTHANVFSVKDLWSVADIPDEYLQYLKRIVGWTPDLDEITDALDFDTLRRLIANSVYLWKNRGPETTIINFLTLVTGARSRIWNWFDFRWVMDETGIGHEADGRDPWLIAIDNTNEMNVRIMDDGSLDHDLVVSMLKLMRPMGETFEVTYLNLLDQFLVDGDDAQWNAIDDTGNTGVDVVDISSGTATLDNTTEKEQLYDAISGSSAWVQYLYAARVRGVTEYGLTFHQSAVDTHYTFSVITTAGVAQLRLSKRVAGADTVIATVNAPAGFTLDPLVWYMLRVQIATESSTNRIVCFVDGVEVINTTDSTLSAGGVGIIHEIGGSVEIDEVEVIGLPVVSDTVTINS